MTLSTQAWIGIGGLTALVAYLAWPSKAKAAPGGGYKQPLPGTKDKPATKPGGKLPAGLDTSLPKDPSKIPAYMAGRSWGHADVLNQKKNSAKPSVDYGWGGGNPDSFDNGYTAGYIEMAKLIAHGKSAGIAAKKKSMSKDANEAFSTLPSDLYDLGVENRSVYEQQYSEGYDSVDSDSGTTPEEIADKTSEILAGVFGVKVGWWDHMPRACSADYGMWTPPARPSVGQTAVRSAMRAPQEMGRQLLGMRNYQHPYYYGHTGNVQHPSFLPVNQQRPGGIPQPHGAVGARHPFYYGGG